MKEKEPEFVLFFNKSISISPKLRMLHLLPGIGKETMWEILEERNKKPFEETRGHQPADQVTPSSREDDHFPGDGAPGTVCKVSSLHFPMSARNDQHFLVDQRAVERIAEAVEVAGKRVLEVGPGKGALTEALLSRGALVAAVEIDQNLVDSLAFDFADEMRVPAVSR